MGRWEPDARGRLEEAAMALYSLRGYENTTVAEIAERAGLTERTFFRHFADKREVLFGAAGTFRERLLAPVVAAADEVAPIDALAAGLGAAAEMLQERRDFSRQRQAIIASSGELQERELAKLASLAGALADALRARGIQEPAASLAGEVAIAVFRAAFERWIADEDDVDFPQLISDSLGQLKALAGGATPRPKTLPVSG
ncbi:MAG TPA: helix-turn-helix domain-containing protein [Solirubrobacteraceae bacterium]|jgi:AcrR family transcriptional regulator|nr:helix-turn-helix domain-containing protein [Solirubrobacteraceae bacterium]